MDFPINFNPKTFVTPSIKDSLNTKFSDVKKLGEATWAQAQKTYIQIKNQATNQVPVGMEQVNIMLKSVAEKGHEYVDTKVDNIIYEKSGYHLSELNNMLAFGNQLWTAISTMYSTGTLPQPEWIVSTANTLKQMDKNNNPMLDEVVSQINTYWEKYKKIINNAYDWAQGRLDKAKNKKDEEEKPSEKTEEEIKKEMIDSSAQEDKGKKETVAVNDQPSKTPETPVSDNTPSQQTKTEVTKSTVPKGCTRKLLSSLKDDIDFTWSNNSSFFAAFKSCDEIDKTIFQYFDDFAYFLVRGISVMLTYKCVTIDAAVSSWESEHPSFKNYVEYVALERSELNNLPDKISEFAPAWSKYFNICVKTLLSQACGQKIQSWRIFKDEDGDLLIDIQRALKSKDGEIVTTSTDSSTDSSDSSTSDVVLSTKDEERIKVSGLVAETSTSQMPLVKTLETIIDSNPDLKHIVIKEKETPQEKNNAYVIIQNYINSNPEFKETLINALNTVNGKKTQDSSQGEQSSEEIKQPSEAEKRKVIDAALNEIKKATMPVVNRLKNSAIGAYNNTVNSALSSWDQLVKTGDNFKNVGTNIANDASAQWNKAKYTVENSIEQGKDLYNRVADDVSTYYNMFKDPKKAKEWLNKLLEAWLSNQSEILVNAFMINKFKAIIDNMKKLADEGFKKDLDMFTKMESAMAMFNEVKEMLYNIKKIPVADSYNDIINVDTSKIESFANKAKNTYNTTYNNVKSSIENSIKSVENEVQSYKTYLDNTVDKFKSLGDNLKSDILNVKEYFTNFAISNTEWIKDTAQSMINSIKKDFNIDFNEFIQSINLNKLKSNIEVSVKKKVLEKIKEKNPEHADEIEKTLKDAIENKEDSTDETSEAMKEEWSFDEVLPDTWSINVSAFSYTVNLDIDIKSIIDTITQDNIQAAISEFIDTKELFSDHLNEEITAAGKELSKSIAELTKTVTETADTLTKSETMINNTLTDFNNNLSSISGSLLRGANNFVSIAEEAFNLDELMPTVKLKAPPFMKYIISAIDTLAPVFKILERLISNYKTNKKMTRDAAILKLSKIQSWQKFKEGFGLINDIKDIIEVKDENEADYIRTEIINDKESVDSIVDECGIVLTQKGIQKYNEFRKFNKQPLLEEDYDGLIMLNENDRFETDKNTHTNEVYIKDTEDSLPASASEVLDNNTGNNCDEDLGLDPEYTDEGYEDDIISDEMMYPEHYDGWEGGSEEIDLESLDLNDPEDLEIFMEFQAMDEEEDEMKKMKLIKDLRKTLQHETDEFEGLQNLLVDNLNLCDNPVSFYNEQLPKPGYPAIIGENMGKIKNNPAIIEFARETLFGDGVEFDMLISPGEDITENHSIALIHKNGKQRIVRSIFSSGTVREGQYGDFAHINGCTRSIIIDDPVYSLGEDITGQIQEIQEEMQEENELYDLITQHLMYSSYPQILMNSESPAETKQKMASGNLVGALDTGETVYKKLVKHFENTQENFHEDILGKKKITKSEAKGDLAEKFAQSIKDVKGNSQKIQEIADTHLEKRRNYILGEHSWSEKKEGIIDLYEKYTESSELYSKCRILSDDGKDIRNDLDLTYYIDLYSKLDIENNSGTWFKEYRDILRNIMNYRRLLQHDNYLELIELLNDKAFKSSEYKLTDIPEDNLWNYLENKFSICPEYNEFYEALEDKIKDKEETPDNFLNVLYNIYEYIKHNDSKFIQQLQAEENISVMDNLLSDENNKLKEFWEKAIKRYKEIEFDKQKEKLMPDEIQDAVWPDKMTITLNRREYDLYLFKDLFSKEDDIILPDEDMDADLGDINDNLDDYTADTSTAAEDFHDIDYEQKTTTIDYTDIRYWQRWCSMATLGNIVKGQSAWATGMIFNGYFVQFPCVLIPLKVVNIKTAKITIVIGLAIRLLTVQPMVIYVNQYNEVNNILVPLTSMLERVKQEYSKYIKYLENVNLNAVQVIINRLENSNTSMMNENKQLEIVLQDLKAFLPTNWADAKKEIGEILGEPPALQNIYRIKNYPKLSDFNTNLNLKIGSNSIFKEGEYNIDFSKFDPSESIERNISDMLGMQDESDKMKTEAGETKVNEEPKTEERQEEKTNTVVDIAQQTVNNIFNNPNNIPGYVDYSKGIPETPETN